MREIDFVPAWYVSVRRHKRMLKAQAGAVAAVAVGLLCWQFFQVRAVHAAERVLVDREAQVEASANRVREHQTQQQLRQQLQTQDRVDTSLGLNVESSRLLAMIDTALPRQGSLTEVVIETDERLKTLAQQAAGKTATPSAERRLKVSIKGVTPSNADVATFYENLRRTGFCDELRLHYSRDRVESAHVMCEFHVEFTINLNIERAAS